MKEIINETLEIVNELLKDEYKIKHFNDGIWEVFYISNGITNYHLKTHINKNLINKQEDKVDFLIDNIIKSIKNVKSEYVLNTKKYNFECI